MNPKTYKKEGDISYTLGAALTMELMHNRPQQVERVYVHSQFQRGEAYEQLCRLCHGYGIPVEENDKAFRILSQKENCFVIGVFRKYSCRLESDGCHVVLVNPSNAGNLGTILRSSAGFRVNDIAIIRPGVDIFDPKTVRASMGALFHMRFAYYDSFDAYQQAFAGHALYPFLLQAKSSLQKTEFRAPFSLIFGNEATGLPGEFLSIGHGVIIPHSGDIDSLNLPIAASIALYQATAERFSGPDGI